MPAPLVNGSGLVTLWSLVAVGAVLLLLAPPSRAQSGGQASALSPGNTVPAQPSAKPPSDLNLPEAFTFPRGEGSPGDVTFTHETHVPRVETDGDGAICAACHRSEFSIRQRGKAWIGEVTMERMRQGELCGRCHNGTKAFGLDDCTAASGLSQSCMDGATAAICVQFTCRSSVGFTRTALTATVNASVLDHTSFPTIGK